MNLKYNPKNFLKFNMSTSSDFIKNQIVIRSKTFENVIATEKPIILTVTGREGFMLMTPEDLKDKIIFTSKPIKDYYLIHYNWIPIKEESLAVLDCLYSSKRLISETLNVEIQEVLNTKRWKLESTL